MATTHTLTLPLSPLTRPISKLTPLFTTTTGTRRYRPFAMAAASTPGTAAATKVVAPAVIVGGGRVGRALQEMGSGQDLLVRRAEAVPLDFEGPILVCTRNDDLDAVLDSTPKSRWNGSPLTNTFHFIQLKPETRISSFLKKDISSVARFEKRRWKWLIYSKIRTFTERSCC